MERARLTRSTGTRPLAVYMVMMQEGLIAQDIAMTIAEHDPQARILQCHSAEAALADLANCGPVDIVFADAADPIYVRQRQRMDAALADRAGTVVMLGTAPARPTHPERMVVLDLPFSSDDLQRFLSVFGPRVGTDAA